MLYDFIVLRCNSLETVKILYISKVLKLTSFAISVFNDVSPYTINWLETVKVLYIFKVLKLTSFAVRVFNDVSPSTIKLLETVKVCKEGLRLSTIGVKFFIHLVPIYL